VNELDFSGKTALVVGGSSGIGNAIAQAFRRRNASVHVWGTRPSAAEYTAEQGSDLGGLHYHNVDVGDGRAIESYEPPFSRLDILVLSQGSVLYGRAEFEMAGFRKVLEINLMSVMACAMKFHPMLVKSAGNLQIVTSSAAFQATKGNPAYSASKTGAFGLTRTLAQAWAKQHVRVNGIAPGFVDTKLTKVTTENPKRLQAALESIPLGRLGTPEDMAGAALFLASPLAAYITGQTLLIDGGMLL
jgi:3-oxoacyl-[acyl-carrier protein] reductase